MNNEYFYFSPKEAREELLRRRSNKEVKKRILEYIGEDIPQNIPNKPFLAMARFVATARIEDFLMYKLSKKLGLYPMWIEYTWDKFHPQNVDKLDLVQIKIDDGVIININIVGEEPEKLKGQKIDEIKTTSGISLIEFHHSIRKGLLPQNYIDISMWLKSSGKAKSYYKKYLKLFLVHGILLENFHVQGEEEFARQVFEPSFLKIKEDIGLVPIVIQQKWKREDGYYPTALKKLIIKHLL